MGDLTVICGTARERGIIVVREMGQMSALDRFLSRMHQIDKSVSLNTVKIADMESQTLPARADYKLFIVIMVLYCGRLMVTKENGNMPSMELKQYVSMELKYLFSPLENKIHIFAPPCNILHIYYNNFSGHCYLFCGLKCILLIIHKLGTKMCRISMLLQ